jgi:hypothetical protein
MSKTENPPFGRGSTYVNGSYTIDANNLPGAEVLGRVVQFEDLDYSSAGAKSSRTGFLVKCLAVRNVAGFALLPKRLVKLRKTSNTLLAEVDGYARTTAEGPVFPIDEWLPAAGVPDDDVFYVVIEGPATVLTPLEADANNVFNVGDVLVSLTAATSGATTAGRVRPQDLTGATALLGDQIQNRIGRALSARTTANTAADLLVAIGRW